MRYQLSPSPEFSFTYSSLTMTLVNISDVESDIDSLEWLVKSPQTVYDLRGNCINNIEVLGGGVYIVNGRKVLIK